MSLEQSDLSADKPTEMGQSTEQRIRDLIERYVHPTPELSEVVPAAVAEAIMVSNDPLPEMEEKIQDWWTSIRNGLSTYLTRATHNWNGTAIYQLLAGETPEGFAQGYTLEKMVIQHWRNHVVLFHMVPDPWETQQLIERPSVPALKTRLRERMERTGRVEQYCAQYQKRFQQSGLRQLEYFRIRGEEPDRSLSEVHKALILSRKSETEHGAPPGLLFALSVTRLGVSSV